MQSADNGICITETWRSDYCITKHTQDIPKEWSALWLDTSCDLE